MSDFVTAPLDDPAAWRGDALWSRTDWSVDLDARQLAELDAALEGVAGVPPEAVTRERFPLPGWSGLLRDVLHTMEGGRGFLRLRGLPVARWDASRARTALWGIGLHLGVAEPQDGAGRLMHDVRDVGRKFGADDSIRYFQTNQAIEFHNDGADIFVLGCLSQGRAGGLTRIVSAVEVFNVIVRRRPDLAVVLQQDFHVDARGQRADGARCQVLPIYAFADGALSVLLKLAYIDSAQRFDDVPPLTQAQKEALSMLRAVLDEDGMALELQLAPGDVLVASNHVTLHGRTAYEDAPGADGRRHMLRLWLTIANGRPLPPHYADTREFASTYARRMGGPSRVERGPPGASPQSGASA